MPSAERQSAEVFSVRPAERFYTHSVPDVPMRSKGFGGIFFFNFGLFCTGCILSQIVKLPSVFPSRRTGQHTDCMKSAVMLLHRKCNFVLLDIDLERFVFQCFLISVKKEFLSLYASSLELFAERPAFFAKERSRQVTLGSSRICSICAMSGITSAFALSDCGDSSTGISLLVQKLRVSFLKQPQIFRI